MNIIQYIENTHWLATILLLLLSVACAAIFVFLFSFIDQYFCWIQRKKSAKILVPASFVIMILFMLGLIVLIGMMWLKGLSL